MNKHKRFIFSLLLMGVSVFGLLFSSTSEVKSSTPEPEADGQIKPYAGGDGTDIKEIDVVELIRKTFDFVQSAEVSGDPGESSDRGDMTLAGTQWRFSWGQVDGETFSPFANQPITLNFDADQINGNGSCNNFFSSYTIDGNSLTIGVIGATRKLCESELMEVEKQFFNALQSANAFTYNIDTLTLSLPNGELHFSANMAVEKTVFIGAEQVDCRAGAGGPRKCLLIKDDPNAEWEFFYDNIAGFEWQEGIEYELRVRITPVENPPADASSLTYELIEIVNQVPVAPSESGGDMTLAGTQWRFSWGQVDGDTFAPFADMPITLNFDTDQINGNGSCNNFFSTYTIDGNSLTIGVIGATRMACELMELEQQFFNALQSANAFRYHIDRLTLSLPNGELHFSANMAVEKTVFIGAEQVDCRAGAGGPRKCLLIKDDPNAEWEFFYDQIAGFEWQEGIEYELRVRITPVENAPADASSVTYELIEIVNQVPVAARESSEAGDMTLAGTQWRFLWAQVDGETFVPFPNSPITLNFDADQINGNGSCNNFFSSYTIDGNSLTIGVIGATAMACEPELMEVESNFFNALQSVNTFTYHIDTLTLSLPNGKLHFRANMAVEKTVFIGAEQADCQAGVGGPRKCLLIKDDPNAEWELFYDQIAGFEWEEGIEYELRVRITPVENSPVDASLVTYELIEIVNQVPAGQS
ncbi:MAG: DUF4377 domain-containing protein [Ardenticatenaceae bacterium]